MKTINPNDLLTHKRFDVVIQHMYASNLTSEFYKNAYKEHPRIWNGFYEGLPRKRGFEDFDNAFKSLLKTQSMNCKVRKPEGYIANGVLD